MHPHILRRLGTFARRAVAAAALLTAGVACAAGEDSPWGRDYFPNVPLITQDGKEVRFFDDLLKDKVVAINFIFTSCTDSCPMETARLREVAQQLGERVGKDVFLYSISIDPANDTPAVLKEYKERFGITTPGWVFLTGKASDITLLRQKLGLYMPELAGSTDHNLSLIVGNQKTGRWQKASPFENPYVLANHLGSVLHNWKTFNKERNDYANAPTKLRQMSKGEQLFRTRCASCHVIGTPGAGAAMHAVGPDLKEVGTRRNRAWLEQWLKQPDKMIAEKDATAMALLAQYKIPMPNLRLNNLEVEALLSYIDEESVRLAPVKAPDMGGAHHAQHAMHEELPDKGSMDEHGQHHH